MEQQEKSPRAQLHTLVGKEMRFEKRADMNGGTVPHHVEEHKQAQKELEEFLLKNPSMREHLETVQDHFFKQLYE